MSWAVQEYERCVRYILPACSRAAGRNIEQTFAILDAKGVGLRHLTGAVKKMLQQVIQVCCLLFSQAVQCNKGFLLFSLGKISFYSV